MCILLNVKKHEKTFALNVDIFMWEEWLEMMLKETYNSVMRNLITKA